MSDQANRALLSVKAAISDLGPLVTEYAWLDEKYHFLDGNDKEELGRRGITVVGSHSCSLLVSKHLECFDNTKIINNGHDNIILLTGIAARGSHLKIRISGSGSLAVFPGALGRIRNILDIWLRSDEQIFYFGLGASSVGSSFELHGKGRKMIIGDDCMLSSNVWLRNYDMHSIFDLDTGMRCNKLPVDVIVERHVWIGQNAIVLAPSRIGFGAIVAAGAFVNKSLAPCTVAAGVPARVVRSNASWCRSPDEITETEVTQMRGLSARYAER